MSSAASSVVPCQRASQGTVMPRGGVQSYDVLPVLSVGEPDADGLIDEEYVGVGIP